MRVTALTGCRFGSWLPSSQIKEKSFGPGTSLDSEKFLCRFCNLSWLRIWSFLIKLAAGTYLRRLCWPLLHSLALLSHFLAVSESLYSRTFLVESQRKVELSSRTLCISLATNTPQYHALFVLEQTCKSWRISSHLQQHPQISTGRRLSAIVLLAPKAIRKRSSDFGTEICRMTSANMSAQSSPLSKASTVISMPHFDDSYGLFAGFAWVCCISLATIAACFKSNTHWSHVSPHPWQPEKGVCLGYLSEDIKPSSCHSGKFLVSCLFKQFYFVHAPYTGNQV